MRRLFLCRRDLCFGRLLSVGYVRVNFAMIHPNEEIQAVSFAKLPRSPWSRNKQNVTRACNLIRIFMTCDPSLKWRQHSISLWCVNRLAFKLAFKKFLIKILPQQINRLDNYNQKRQTTIETRLSILSVE